MGRLRVGLAVVASSLVLTFAVSSTVAHSGPGSGGPNVGPAAPPFPTDGNGFDPANFGPDSIVVDNRFLPLVPGTRFVYRGSSLDDEGNRISHSVVFTVTDLTKEIAGVRTIVGWDRDFSRGELEEEELIFLAQDAEGNVWHLGQYPEHYSEGQFEGAAPFLVGYLEGAKAGIMMQADPRLDTPAYPEGYAPPPYFWDDHARVYRKGQHTCVPAGCYDQVLVTEEFEPTKPGAFQLKFYAPHVGYVRVGWRGKNEDEREVLVLVEIRQLDAAAMERVRARAYAMEARANVYGLTAPLEPAPPSG
ncbi:MAG: hypothetical protein ACE14W_06080 [Candidatus Velamenicoccus archaeovorus]